MGLIEAIVCKMSQQIKYLIGQININTIAFTALEEIFLLSHQNSRFFLTHGAAEKIRLS